MRRTLLVWFGTSARAFPWRAPDYSMFGLLLAEMLLRQTGAERVALVLPSLLEAFPDPAALAAAEPERLERMLRVLGLQRQRRDALLAAARHLVEQTSGAVPDSIDDLREIPHVGEYTAHAVAAFGVGAPVPVVDVNVMRVLARVGGRTPPSDLRRAGWIWEMARALVPCRGTHEFDYAMLDLGALVCSARKPRCEFCPWQPACHTGRMRSATE